MRGEESVSHPQPRSLGAPGFPGWKPCVAATDTTGIHSPLGPRCRLRAKGHVSTQVDSDPSHARLDSCALLPPGHGSPRATAAENQSF